MADTIKLLLFLTLCTFTMSFDDITMEEYEGSNKILSRRKRYLVFPDGSSFQVVICEQNHGYLQLGNIVWFANTAALAWELPTDPKLFHIFKNHEKEFINRNGISKSIYFLDEDGKVLSKKPYHKKFLVNPAFAKRSVTDTNSSISIKQMHEKQKKGSAVLQDLDNSSIDFHRYGRKDFYSKLGEFLNALGLNGQECVLRMLCESGQGTSEQGTFFEEIMRATFTFPRRQQSSKHLYDKAHSTKDDCRTMYPACNIDSP
ncbi:uncharacterized protein LOC111003605 [Pieris rapae]|uniref:uncharacterized protein LOC111003605 n=1 Tax=Pieris rapae TaxID=64459 RepID=UPI001E27AE03|nr:uncharacterized protein LOC111003605 [Pieris rapae]XP_045484314.1 uncharacterized protein LOC111003605 [Pieris rapae]